MDLLPFDLGRPWMLFAGAAAIAWSIWIARRSIAGQSRFWSRFSLAVRILLLVLLALGLADARVEKRSDRLNVLFLVDASASIPSGAVTGEGGVLDQLERACAALEQGVMAGVIVFGSDAAVEAPLAGRFARPRMQAVVDREGTDLAAALCLADATFAGTEGGRRAIVISDGNATRGDEVAEARNLAASGAVVDVLPIRYSYEHEVLVESVQVPAEVHREEPYVVSAILQSEVATKARVVLAENDRLVAERTVDLTPGKTRVDFARLHAEPERFSYTVRVFPEPGAGGAQDALEKNNVGYAHTLIRGVSRVLFLGDEAAHVALLGALASAKIACEALAPEQVSLRLEDYFGYDTVIVADAAAHEFGADALRLLAGVVKNLGLGFVMIGGPDAFGAGGYKNTPIEKMLPVDMDVKQRKVMTNGALIMILHTCEFSDGNRWAKLIAQAAVDTLQDRDLVGALVWDMRGQDAWGVPLARAENRQEIKDQIGQLVPMDMPAFEPTMQLALDALVPATAAQKHVIIISDGDPAPPSRSLIVDYIAAKVSATTICIQPHGNSDTGVMKKIALDTGGRYYFVEDPRKLPQIFTREAQHVQRSLILEEPFVPRIAFESEPLRGLAGGGLPRLLGHVITTAKPLAETPLVNQYGDPVLSHWRYGLGKSAAFTSDATGRWAGEWIAWPGFETFWAQLVRSVARRGAGDLFRVDRTIEGDRGKILLDAIDPEGHFIDGLALEGTVLSPGIEEERVTFQQVGPGRYEADFAARQAGTYLLSFAFDDGAGMKGTMQTGLTVSFSPEYRQLRSNEERLLAVARAADGRVLDWDSDFFSHEFPERVQEIAVWETLVALATLLFVLDVFFRRVLLSRAPIRRFVARLRRRSDAAPTAAGKLLDVVLAKRRVLAPERPQRRIEVSGVEPSERGAAAVPERPPAAGEATPSAAAGSPPAAAEGEQTSFTGRLLEAKRRAREKDSRRDER